MSLAYGAFPECSRWTSDTRTWLKTKSPSKAAQMKPALGPASPLGDLLPPPAFPRLPGSIQAPGPSGTTVAKRKSNLPRTKSFRPGPQRAWASCLFSGQLRSGPGWKPSVCNPVRLKCAHLSVLGPLSIRVTLSGAIWISELGFPQSKIPLVHLQRESLLIYTVCFSLKTTEDPTRPN